MKSLHKATEKIGINLKGSHNYRDFVIVQGNANRMDCFPDRSFDVVLSNATVEHDKYFWKTIAEIHRVVKKDGLIVIGAPGYTDSKFEQSVHKISRLPLLRRLQNHRLYDAMFSTTITYRVHKSPGDFYRFSLQAFKEVFFENCHDIKLETAMWPPRIIGSGRKS
jgi:ubiquinone/menaquinone biosynthesis C-methylase UbiE